MKLSFSLSSSKSSSSSRPLPSAAGRDGANRQEERAASSSKAEFVTEFDPNKTLGSDSSLPAAIAPLANTDSWRVPKRMKNLEPPPSADVDSNSSAVADRFELEVPQSESGAVTYGLILRKAVEGSVSDHERNPDADIVMRSEPALTAEQKLKEDIEKLPDDRGFEEFEDIAVEDFSKALLAGYGWKTGQGIGRNAKEDTKLREYKRWAGNGGLGFKSDLPAKKDSEQKKSSSGVSKESSNLDREKEKLLKKTKKPTVREERERSHKESNGGSSSWLTSHIKVRIISKEFKRGRFYLKKGKIVDVAGPMICDVSIDESGEMLQGVSQEILETALPRRGGSVLVLFGRHKGCYGTLMEKDSEKETAVVRDEDNHELIKVRLDQIAEYVGDPSVLGY